MSQSATKDGTLRYAKRFSGRAAEGHFRETQGFVASSLGIGTYLGQPDDKTDESYTAAAVAAVENGINLMRRLIIGSSGASAALGPPSNNSPRRALRATS